MSGATPAEAGTFGSNSSAAGSPTNGGNGFDLSGLFPDGLQGGKSKVGSETKGTLPAAKEPSLEDLLRQVPMSLRQSLNEKAMEVLQNSSAAEKQQLLDQLSNSVPQNAGSILTDFLSGVTDPNGQGGALSSISTQLGQNESSLLHEIAGIYAQRNDIIAKSKQYLAGVPREVQSRVLQDWHADAMGLNVDPDPGTNVNTRIDERIVRQLNRADIALDRLDRDLRTRLSQAMR